MHFLTDTDPIFLHTDASDYGIGGYLFQIINEKHHPVAFHSRSFSKPQLRWSVPQKEAFGIYDTITKLSVLLQGRDFTLRTDHRNLLYIKENSNPMIIRWYMALSEFSFHLEFISGADNSIADWMSRLCRNHMIDNSDYTSEDVLFASIIPKFCLTKFQYKQIGRVHNSTVGHFGVERTIKRLQKTQSWEFMRQHVKHFIANCPCCQKMSMLKLPIAAHPFTTSTYTPMECLNIDFIGPFPDGGSVLVIVDTCTRWVELFATADVTALSAATALLQHFGRFGAPLQLRSDNGPHFVAEVIREFLSLIGVDHCLTLAYSSQENAIVERYNKEINRHIRALTFDNTSLRDYKLSLPFVQRILNSNYSDRLKISAADLLFGKIVNLDRGLFLPQEERLLPTKPLSTYMSNLLNIQDNLLKASAKELLRTDLLHQSSKLILIPQEYVPNSYVLVHYRTNAPPSRLHTFWRGPMRVLNGNDSRYLLYDLITHKEKIYHVSDMKPFLYDPAITDPLDIARRDYMEFFIDKILAHDGDLTRKRDITFLVHWLGYADRHDSWEPYSYLRDTDQLHAYLTENNLSQLIPKKFNKPPTSLH
jgi:transposase InsO family protein